MDLGTYQQGQELPLVLATAADPSATPRANLCRADGTGVASVPLPADDRPAGPGLFRTGWMLDGRTPPGDYLIVYRWLDGGSPRQRVQRFRVRGGGSADGAVVAMHAAVRPARTAVLMQTDNGRLTRGLNPEV